VTAGGPRVLVHGAWHGAWSWERVVPLLDGEVITPTLTGLGERAAEASAAVDLETHIGDVLDAIGDATGVTLVAHSYAGFVAAGVVARRPEAIARLVLLDGFVPETGQAMTDQIGERGPAYLAEAERDPGWRAPPAPIAALGVTDPDDAAWAGALLTPQPVQTYVQRVAGPVDFSVVADRTYVACLEPALPVLDESRARVRATGWRYAELRAGHDAMLTHPREVAALL
jgi:pimeloyl-ACP methyl ester carboxylesterase